MCIRDRVKNVSGVVLDKKGESIIGASVLVKGTTNAVSYTHLDVYKRQHKTLGWLGVSTICFMIIGFSITCLLYTSRCV